MRTQQTYCLGINFVRMLMAPADTAISNILADHDAYILLTRK